MTDTSFECSVCGTVFSDHQARIIEVELGEDELGCPECGSTLLEPYEFDPDAPVVDPLGGPEEEEDGS